MGKYVPISIDTDLMTNDEIRAKLQKGYDDVENGRVYVAAEVFERFKRTIREKGTDCS